MAVERLTAVGWGLVTFGLVIALGMIVLTKFGDQIVTCSADKLWNATSQLCGNATGTASGSGNGFAGVSSVITNLGSTGLAGWLPVVIVVIIAGLIFSYFGMGGAKNY